MTNAKTAAQILRVIVNLPPIRGYYYDSHAPVHKAQPPGSIQLSSPLRVAAAAFALRGSQEKERRGAAPLFLAATVNNVRMAPSAFVQDFYTEDFAHCYGCGRLNTAGLHVKTAIVGDEAVATFRPRAEHIALPGFVYGGLIASLIDCHGIGTAAAAAERADGRGVGDAPAPRFVTASLHVDYLKPTPLGPELELRARATSVAARKIVVAVEVRAGDALTARGEVVAVRMPDTMRARP
jgi:acyl-coenzyme A thioesterase PaaI-like protein